MKKNLLLLIFAFLGAGSIYNATAQGYDPFAVQKINALIQYNGLNATPNDPESWGFASWEEDYGKPMKLTRLYLQDWQEINMYGKASLSGLTSLTDFWCGNNNFTEIDLSNCSQLNTLYCHNNNISKLEYKGCTQLRTLGCYNNNISKLDLSNCKDLRFLYCGNNILTELNLTNCSKIWEVYCNDNQISKLDLSKCTDLDELVCRDNNLSELDLKGLNKLKYFDAKNQTVSLTLQENAAGEYTTAISLNNPSFSNDSVSYSNGVIKSMDTTVTSTSFVVETNKEGYTLSGTIYFSYSMLSVNQTEKISLKIYPNPATETATLDFSGVSAGVDYIRSIELYSLKGQLLQTQPVQSETTTISLIGLAKGTYILKVQINEKNENRKIIKQ
jgi:hypothetical protein